MKKGYYVNLTVNLSILNSLPRLKARPSATGEVPENIH